MKFVTYQDYLDYLKTMPTKLEDTSVEYKFRNSKDINKKHDKLFRNILRKKREIAKLLNQFLYLKEYIEPHKLTQCNTDFITREYKSRQADVIYKFKGKPIYFLVEHQSTVDYEISTRIEEYIGEIMRKESIVQKTYLKDKIYPIVVPIVIYTGLQKWNGATNFAKKQYDSYNYRKYKINLEYNLIAIQDYTYEELLEKQSLFASSMIIEKAKDAKEIEIYLDKIVEIIKDQKDKQSLIEIIVHVVKPFIGEHKTEELVKRIKGKGEVGMSPFQKAMYDLQEKSWKKGVKENTSKIVKSMLKHGEDDEKIIKYTGISKTKLESIKSNLAKL